MTICRDRLLKQRLDILDQIANNPKADWRARVDAHHLAAEIFTAAMKFYTEGPAILARRHQFPRTSLTGAGLTGINLELRNPLPYSRQRYEQQEEEQEQ